MSSEIDHDVCTSGCCANAHFSDHNGKHFVMCQIIEDKDFLGEYKGGVPLDCPFLVEHFVSGETNECGEDKQENM